MKPNLKQRLQEERAELTGEVEAIFALAENEDGRELAKAEQTREKEIDERVTAIDKQLEIIKRQEARERGQANLAEWMGSSGETKPDPESTPIQGWASFGHYLQAVHRAALNPSNTDPRLVDPKLIDPKIYAATGASSLVDADGHFLVQTQSAAGIREKMFSTGEILQRIDIQPIGPGFDSFQMYMVDEESRVAGSRFGGVRAYWVEAGGSITKSKPTFVRKTLKVKKVAGLVYADNELLEDAVALEGFIQRKLPEELKFVAEDAIYEGTGVGQPLGILNHACAVEVAKESGQPAATVLWKNIQKIEPQLFSMNQVVGTGGVPVYLPASGAAGSPFASLMGRPVIPVEYCATLGTVGDIMLCDWSQYGAIDKGGVQAASSMHVQFTTDEMAFRFTYRIDGSPAWTTTLTPFKGSNTQSPFIKLATRA
jgi:HK97 family phage major capsid protein